MHLYMFSALFKGLCEKLHWPFGVAFYCNMSIVSGLIFSMSVAKMSNSYIIVCIVYEFNGICYILGNTSLVLFFYPT